MAATAYSPLHAPSKPLAEPSADTCTHPDTDGLDPCAFGSEALCVEAPLTSEPPLPEAEPLTSESPFADAMPLTSESSPELTAVVPEQGVPSFEVPEVPRS
ncbi:MULTISPECIES: hypothetical protein [unclassified Streptomyces]|uniref:hypothetical protein n=1 Tax=unclassified Streptomyces TaxID=2593676 RepID=UPI0019041D06|nr:hypothetical protein [Streptomyces sp. HSG2]